MRTLRQDGWQKVISGLSTPEEVMKVTSVEEVGYSRESGISPAEWQNYGRDSGEDNQATSGLEKRTYMRLDERLNISYKILDKDKGLVKHALSPEHLSVTENISAGGLLFTLNEPLSVGAVLDLKLELPDGKKPIECFAKVVRIEMPSEHNYKIAVCFLDLSGSQRSRLEEYIKSEKI
jgi:hypothetical protein